MAFALGLALVVAESAMADVGPLPVPTPSLPSPPALPSVPSVPAVPAVPAVTGRVPVPVQPPAVPVVEESQPAASQPSPGGTGQQSVRRAAPLGSGGRPAPTVPAARAGRAAESTSGGIVRPRSGGSGFVPAATPGRPASLGRVVRRERRLRRAVGRYRACLDGLPTLERRVLVLRAGLGPRPARTRARVARVLDLSERRVRRIERRGLRRLRGLCGGGGEPAPAGGVAGPAAPGFAHAGFSRALVAAATFGSAPAAAPDRIEVKGEQESSGGGRGIAGAPKLAPPAVAEPPAAVVAGRGDGKGEAGGTDLTLPLLGLAALLAFGLAFRGVARSVRD